MQIKKIKNKLRKITPLFTFYKTVKKMPREIKMKKSVDSFFISPPKAGRTWIRVLLSKLFQEEFGVKFDPFNPIIKIRQGNSSFKIGLTHDFSGVVYRKKKLNFRKWKYKQKKIIFMSRDPRDIIVSQYFEETKRRESGFKGSISEFIRNEETGIKRLINFMNMWINNKSNVKDFHLLRYEDMKEDPFNTVLELINFLDIKKSIQKKSIMKAISFSSFKNMRKMEKSNKLNNKGLSPRNKNNKKTYKTRKGKVGDFKDHLNKKDIRFLNKECKNLKKEFNYNF